MAEENEKKKQEDEILSEKRKTERLKVFLSNK